MEFQIDKMNCGGCARSVTQAIESLDPEAEVEATPATRRVMVKSNLPREAFLPVLAEAGYPAV